MRNKKETGRKIIGNHVTTTFNRQMYRWRCFVESKSVGLFNWLSIHAHVSLAVIILN